MPISAAAAAGITAAASALSTGTNAYAQGRMNKKTRQWNEKMYAQQRGDSLKDWAMVNDYNSPQAQMQRFKDAGLNPNLIYGQSNEAPSVRSSDAPSWNPRAPEVQFDAGSIMGSYYDTQVKQAQVDQLRQSTTVAVQDAALKAAQTANTAAQTAKTEFETGLASDLRATSMQVAEANLRATNVNTDLALRGANRADLLASSSIAEATQRIIQSRAQTDNTRQSTENMRETLLAITKDNELRDLDLQLRRAGINPNDSMLMRIIGRAVVDNNGKILPWKEIKSKLIDALMKFIE